MRSDSLDGPRDKPRRKSNSRRQQSPPPHCSLLPEKAYIIDMMATVIQKAQLVRFIICFLKLQSPTTIFTVRRTERYQHAITSSLPSSTSYIQVKKENRRPHVERRTPASKSQSLFPLFMFSPQQRP